MQRENDKAKVVKGLTFGEAEWCGSWNSLYYSCNLSGPNILSK